MARVRTHVGEDFTGLVEEVGPRLTPAAAHRQEVDRESISDASIHTRATGAGFVRRRTLRGTRAQSVGRRPGGIAAATGRESQGG